MNLVKKERKTRKDMDVTDAFQLLSSMLRRCSEGFQVPTLKPHFGHEVVPPAVLSALPGLDVALHAVQTSAPWPEEQNGLGAPWNKTNMDEKDTDDENDEYQHACPCMALARSLHPLHNSEAPVEAASLLSLGKGANAWTSPH